MRLVRLAILGESPCHLCAANCCKQNGHAYAVLLEPAEWRRFAAYSQAITFVHEVTLRSERVLPYIDGRCQFLGGDNLCTIYEDRPSNCRRFQCIPGYNHGGGEIGRHSEFLRANPAVVGILERL